MTSPLLGPHPALLCLLGCLVAVRLLKLGPAGRARVLLWPALRLYRLACWVILATARAAVVLADLVCRLPAPLYPLAALAYRAALRGVSLALRLLPVLGRLLDPLVRAADLPELHWSLVELAARAWALSRFVLEVRGSLNRRRRPAARPAAAEACP